MIKKTLLDEVALYSDGEQLNFSRIAKNYNIRNRKGELAKNGRQIVKEFLIHNDVDLNRFKQPSGKGRRISLNDEKAHRRKKKVIFGCMHAL